MWESGIVNELLRGTFFDGFWNCFVWFLLGKVRCFKDMFLIVVYMGYRKELDSYILLGILRGKDNLRSCEALKCFWGKRYITLL
jgi:hypothetical protein